MATTDYVSKKLMAAGFRLTPGAKVNTYRGWSNGKWVASICTAGSEWDHVINVHMVKASQLDDGNSGYYPGWYYPNVTAALRGIARG